MASSDPARRRREAILLESMPPVGGCLGLVVAGVFALVLPDNSGTPRSSLEALIAAPLVLSLLAAAFLFAFSGIGWIAAGRVLIGIVLMFGRLYMASWVYAWF